MTVGELKTELEKHPDNMQVFVAERKSEFTYGLINSVYKKKINLKEEPDGEVLATETVVVIDEE